MQYFLGYSSFYSAGAFSATLFVEIRERLSVELLARINEVITVNHIQDGLSKESIQPSNDVEDNNRGQKEGNEAKEDFVQETERETGEEIQTNRGKLLVDATVAPQDITFLKDLKLLDAAMRKSEQLIDRLYDAERHGKVKPWTYRKIARKN